MKVVERIEKQRSATLQSALSQSEQKLKLLDGQAEGLSSTIESIIHGMQQLEVSE